MRLGHLVLPFGLSLVVACGGEKEDTGSPTSTLTSMRTPIRTPTPMRTRIRTPTPMRTRIRTPTRTTQAHPMNREA